MKILEHWSPGNIVHMEETTLEFRIKMARTMVHNIQNHWAYGLCPSSRILNISD
jgi:hypothetical protein